MAQDPGQLSGISLILPVYNEQDALPDVLQQCVLALSTVAEQHEIIVVDDGSNDGSVETVLRLSGALDHVRVICHQTRRGLGAAIATGLSLSSHPVVCYMDSDGQFAPTEICKLVRLIPHFSIISGRRAHRADGLFRLVISRLWNCLIGIFFGLRTKDIDCGLKVFTGAALSITTTCQTAAAHLEFLLCAKRKHLPWVEIEVSHRERIGGKATGNDPVVLLSTAGELFRLVFRAMW